MMKDNLRNKNRESYEIMRFNSVKSKIWKNDFFFLVRIYIKKNSIEYFMLLKKNFFSCVYIKEKYYLVFCFDKNNIFFWV